MDVVEAEAALDAQPVVIGRAVAPLGVEDLLVLDLIGDLAADAAIRAQRIDLAIRHTRRASAFASRSAPPASARRSGRPARIRRRRRRSIRPSGRRSRTRSSRRAPRYAMPITSLTCTSRQARTHRSHWMQASRLTRIAGWLASACQRSRRGKAALGRRRSSRPSCQNFEVGIVRGGARRLVGDQQLHHHSLRLRPRARSPSAPSCRRRRALAGGRQHALALDLHHAGAAIAVGPIAGLGRVAEMRDVAARARFATCQMRLARLRLRPAVPSSSNCDCRHSAAS